MKLLLAVMCLLLLFGCNDATVFSNDLQWHDSEIVVVVNQSVDNIGDPDIVRALIESSFYAWVDVMDDRDIDLIFEYRKCGPYDNCIYMREFIGGAGRCIWKEINNEIIAASIVINDVQFKTTDDETGCDFGRVMMHEVGHFFGLRHSNNADDVMYPYVAIVPEGPMKTLGVGDISAIRERY